MMYSSVVVSPLMLGVLRSVQDHKPVSMNGAPATVPATTNVTSHIVPVSAAFSNSRGG